MNRSITYLVLCIFAIMSVSCSLLVPGGDGKVTQATQTAQAISGAKQTEAARPAPTCIPQPVGSCTTPNQDEPIEISGDIPYTSPFFLNTISEPFVLLEDEAGFVFRDKEFRFKLEGQVIGPVDLDEDMKMTYSLALPSVPQGTYVDVDNNGAKDLGLQVFAIAYWSNTWGDPFLEERDGKGWSTAYTSAITDPEDDNEIVGGTLLVWSPDDEQGFPSGFGTDHKLFTADDPVQKILAGYSLVDLSSEPFRVYKESRPQLTLIEGAGAVKDYASMTYADAFEALYQKVSVEYPFTAEKQVNWQALYAEFQPQFDRASTDQEFYSLMRSFALRIPDGHVNLSLDPDIFYQTYGGGFGMVLVQLSDEKVIAKDILPDSPADKAGIQPGAEILTWDGQPVVEAIAAVVPGFGSYSTDHTLHLAQVTFLTRRPPDTRVEVQFRNSGSNQTQKAAVKTVPEYDSLFLSMAGFNQDKIEMPIFAKTLEGSGLAYIRINTFSDDYALMAKLWERYLQNAIDNEAPGLILDLRSNSGGSLGIAMDFAGFFFDHEINLYENFYYSETTRNFEPTGYPTIIKPAPAYYQGPIAVLVGPDCVSACEGFAYALQREDRSVIIGEYPTAGAFGEVGLGQYTLPGDYSIQFPTGRPESEDGKLVIEGEGVIPKIVVPVTQQSVLGGEDTILAAAEKALIDLIR